MKITEESWLAGRRQTVSWQKIGEDKGPIGASKLDGLSWGEDLYQGAAERVSGDAIDDLPAQFYGIGGGLPH